MMQLKYSTSSTLVSTELELYFKSKIVIILIFLYRATMERTRNYIQNGQFSGEFFKEIFASILFSIFAGNESKNALPDSILKNSWLKLGK